LIFAAFTATTELVGSVHIEFPQHGGIPKIDRRRASIARPWSWIVRWQGVRGRVQAIRAGGIEMSTVPSMASPEIADEGPKGPLDRFLGMFADVRGGEGVTALLLMLNIFLLLAAYYLLKTIREPLILSVPGGAEVKSYSAAATAGLLIVLVPLYSAVASRVSRVKLINGVTLFFIACLVAFFALSRASVPIGVAFFIWVGIFSLMVIAQLWAFANDVYTVEQGKRLFAIVGFGAALGAIAGSFATGQMVKQFGPYPFMLGAAALLGVCMLLTNMVHVREKRRHESAPRVPVAGEAAEDASNGPDAGVTGRSGFALVFADRYLLLIAFLMLVYNLVNTNGEYILGKTVVMLYARAHGAAAMGGLDEKKAIGEFYGNFFTIVNVITAVLQAFVVSRVLKRFGVRVALLVLPVVALGGYLTMAFVPLLSFIRTAKMAENGLDYSLQNTTRNALYLPTSREAKYKAKQANDTFFVRFGDVLSAGIVFAGTTWLGFAPKHFALLNVGLIVIWLLLAVVIGRRFKQMSGTA
jgi:AAA family ATP:ADP antiporter